LRILGVVHVPIRPKKTSPSFVGFLVPRPLIKPFYFLPPPAPRKRRRTCFLVNEPAREDYHVFKPIHMSNCMRNETSFRQAICSERRRPFPTVTDTRSHRTSHVAHTERNERPAYHELHFVIYRPKSELIECIYFADLLCFHSPAGGEEY
jgi:hypothetical protein